MIRELRASSLILVLGVALASACAESDDNAGGGDGATGGAAGAGGAAGDDAGTAGAAGAPGGAAGAAGADAGGCVDDTGCVDDPGGPYCDVATGTCVECLTSNDTCAQGYYCEANACVAGCNSDNDCVDQVCDTAKNVCVECISDGTCPAGTICLENVCTPGCNANQPCVGDLECCNGECIDTQTDVDNCSACDNACPAVTNAARACYAGICGMGTCDTGYIDCNQDPADGCEGAGSCTCDPQGPPQECYFGPTGTAGVGECKKGSQTCNSDGSGWGVCTGQVLPTAEICGNGKDDDCNGTVDDNPDQDGDGWTRCGGDCCDRAGGNCLNPELVNPGAFEVAGNGVDDDCDGTVDNTLAACDDTLASDSSDPLDYARAIDLCQMTTENPTDPLLRKWGVISAGLHLANAAGSPAAVSRSIRDGFGSVITNQKGQRLAVLSTGNAADNSGDTNPNFADFQPGVDTGTFSALPADYLSLNGGSLPNAPGCPAPRALVGDIGINPVMLKLRVRVPTNAKSFSAKLYFFSSEYPEWVCTPFNDFFVTLVDSTSTSNPPDKNIAIYQSGTSAWPVGVNILKAAPGLFTQCQNADITWVKPNGTRCDTSGSGTYSGCTGTNELTGTGFDLTGAVSLSCTYDGMRGGGTGWLNMKGNVKPGETMELRFAIWDTGDANLDSVVLLDDFEWSLNASSPGVTPQ